MPESRQCVCTICSIERELEGGLASSSAGEAYAALRAAFPVLAPFPTASSVLAHTRHMRHSNGSGEASDRIFGALRDGLEKLGAIAETLLLLAVVPTLHATVSSFARACPTLNREDLAQQAVAIVLTHLHGHKWRGRETHLAYSLARELRRDVFLWAKNETRFVPEPDSYSPAEPFVSAADLFERDVQLRHFLHRSLATGALDSDDLELLIEFKLEGGVQDQRHGPVTNAVRQRMKRLLCKMRRHAHVSKPR